MSETVGQLVIKSALPKGSAWNPVPGGNYDQLLEATGDIIDLILAKTENARTVRNALKTIILDDLEREFGVIANDSLTEAERRIVLNTKITNSIIDGNPDTLQTILREIDSQFNVYQNDPPVDPQTFIDQGFLVISTGRGDTKSGAIPEESWPLVFFVGGEATRDVDGSILTMTEIVLPLEKESLFVNPIIAYKGIYTWCALTVVLGTKQNLKDAVDNNICDANGNQIYCLFNFENEGYEVDDNGDFLVDDNGDNLLVYF